MSKGFNNYSLPLIYLNSYSTLRCISEKNNAETLELPVIRAFFTKTEKTTPFTDVSLNYWISFKTINNICYNQCPSAGRDRRVYRENDRRQQADEERGHHLRHLGGDVSSSTLTSFRPEGRLVSSSVGCWAILPRTTSNHCTLTTYRLLNYKQPVKFP